ncbi:MAG: hypothetical protein F4138_02000 [Acidimicrobiia bacterium]|nr:hypothetical protein [Acidimicrobiia bacterium]
MRAGIFALTLALLASVLALAPAALAQVRNSPPEAIAGDDYALTPGVDTTGYLNASGTFDVEDNQSSLTYRWSILTEAYNWLTIIRTGTPLGRTAEFQVPPLRLVNRASIYHIDFELTVTDSGGLSATDIIRVTLNQPPEATITMSAKLPHPNPTDTNGNGRIDDAERYTVDAVIDAPFEGDNDANDWDVQEGARITLTGSSSTSGLSDERLTYAWQRRAARPNLTGFNIDPAISTQPTITIDLPETLRNQATAYVQYRLVVTNQSGVSDTALISITLHDQPAAPTVQIALRNASQPAQIAYKPNPNQINQPARYVVAPGQTVQLMATADDKDGTQARHLVHAWQATTEDVAITQLNATRRGTTSLATYTAPSQLPAGQTHIIQVATVGVTDLTDRTTTVPITFIVTNNQAPEAVAPADLISEDGARGGIDGTGIVTIPGLGFDSNDDTLTYLWQQVDANNVPLADPPVVLINPTEPTTSFQAPELRSGRLAINLLFTVTDSWGVFDTDVVTITVFGHNDPPSANAGSNQKVQPRSTVVLDATATTDPDPNEHLTYLWAYTAIAVNPLAVINPITSQDQNALRAFWPTGGTSYPDVLTSQRTVRPTFRTPNIINLRSVRLTFTLTVTDTAGNTSQDEVHVTVVGRFFSGVIDGPDYCHNRSLGGPRTYASDADKDGVAEVCSLRTTRREAAARQQALNTVASLNTADFNREVRQACRVIDGEDFTQHGDKPADLAKDVCSTGVVAPQPQPPDLTANPQFFSGPVIDGPNFCFNFSLGGAVTYPHDGNGDGIAETCALPYTRREAIARQTALDTFASHPAFTNALITACLSAVVAQVTGDKPEDLAEDVCANARSLNPNPQTGTPLPS